MDEMASVQRKPIMGVWVEPPAGSRGQSVVRGSRGFALEAESFEAYLVSTST